MSIVYRSVYLKSIITAAMNRTKNGVIKNLSLHPFCINVF